MSVNTEQETVRQRYAAAAVEVTEGGTACCGSEPVEADENFGSPLYAAGARDVPPAEAVAVSLGCGNPDRRPAVRPSCRPGRS